MSTNEQRVTWRARLRNTGGQVGINILAAWIGSLLLTAVTWLVAPANWHWVVAIGCVGGVVVGAVAVVTDIVGLRRWFVASAMGFGTSVVVVGVDLLKNTLSKGDLFGVLLAALFIIQGVGGIGMGVSSLRSQPGFTLHRLMERSKG